MKTPKPTFEKISPEFGSSLRVKQHNEQVENNLPFWHFHPELELVYINKAKGKRHIGSHLSYFNNSQLILIGANLPHSGFTDRFTSTGTETIVQFQESFLGKDFFEIPELHMIKKLFERAKKGIVFGIETKKKLNDQLLQLNSTTGLKRILLFIEILNELSLTEDYTILNADGYSFEVKPQDNLKIDIIFDHVRNHFTRTIPLEEIASKVSMTVPAFCRYYKKVTGKTFTQFVNEFRIVHATKLLTESHSSITEICFECGFNNFSHFNKLFKKFTGKSPLKYRNEMKQLVIQ
ncbi:AraC family transcriptional regulator [Urechidicola vernalis]|uniref:AraC family transcriptional regulator n=1 Tax=Urechidicola vernalis TaxID=3075600 RepID=A0ABU2Y4J5_9FLAO|nr:AraC family transcriptional regulator [Urechidicola sp. P050]MDT0553118.1 AraC family transcriptional regulator [Urechidicola sp. P050]